MGGVIFSVVAILADTYGSISLSGVSALVTYARLELAAPTSRSMVMLTLRCCLLMNTLS